jgi:transcriptional regulator with XRE-family HTH domain
MDMKTTNRKSRKPTGRFAPAVKEFRVRVEGIDKDGKPIMSQADFGKIFQTAPITVSRWELGIQDPPAPMLKWLALGAGNLGYRDLEMVFLAGEAPAALIDPKDRNILSLLACLMRWKEVGRSTSADRTADIHRTGQTVFELARSIVADLVASDDRKDLAKETLVAEMSRLLEEIHNAEHQLFSPTLRAAGLPMYSTGESDLMELNRMKEIRKRQLGREPKGDRE